MTPCLVALIKGMSPAPDMMVRLVYTQPSARDAVSCFVCARMTQFVRCKMQVASGFAVRVFSSLNSYRQNWCEFITVGRHRQNEGGCRILKKLVFVSIISTKCQRQRPVRHGMETDESSRRSQSVASHRMFTPVSTPESASWLAVLPVTFDPPHSLDSGVGYRCLPSHVSCCGHS